MMNYQQQARDFLSRNGLSFHATRCVPQKRPPFEDNNRFEHGHYWIVIRRDADKQSLAFDFWTSHNDETRRSPLGPKAPTPYDVLSSISSDINTPETFKGFCAEFGYEEDSRKAEKVFQAASEFSHKLRKFFTTEEQAQLSEIS